MTEHSDKLTGRYRILVRHVHLVFITKHRYPAFTARHRDPMEQITRDIRADSGGELAELSGEAEHVHLLVNHSPTVAISRVVNSPNGVPSRRLRQQFPGLRHHWWPKRLWPGPYFAGSIGEALISLLRQHIEQQKPPR
jgi:putative transposase